MSGLMIGLDLCDSCTQISCSGIEETYTFPTLICREKEEEHWHIGEDACRCALEGKGVLVDKLLKMVKKEGTSTIGGIRYPALTLLKLYLEQVLELARQKFGAELISQLVLTLPKVDAKLMDTLMYCSDYLGIPRESFHIISHTEGFVYYILSQKKDIWNNHVGMFDLTEESFCYYEMKVQRGLRQSTVIAEREKLEEGFNLDILKTPSGRKLADKILSSCGERLLQRKLYSSVFLTGKGFETQDWAEEFMHLLCSRRKVYADMELFARGAAYRAADYEKEKTSYPFVIACEGRLNATVSIRVMKGGQKNQLVLASAGDNWYEARSKVELIVDGERELEFLISYPDPQKKKTVKIPLEHFPVREDKTVRIQIRIGFLDEHTMVVTVKDQGFGDLYPATRAFIRQEVML